MKDESDDKRSANGDAGKCEGNDVYTGLLKHHISLFQACFDPGTLQEPGL